MIDLYQFGALPKNNFWISFNIKDILNLFTMHFKRFLEININNDNEFIIFKNNKILYEPQLKTFLLSGDYINVDFDNSFYIGIAESSNKKIYARKLDSFLT